MPEWFTSARAIAPWRIARRGNRRALRAFTLVEVLLTLALIAGMAALLWPSLDKPFAAIRLRKSADLVRAHWTSARVQAMSTGQVQSFRYQPGTGSFEVEPWQFQETDSPDAAPEDFSALPYVTGPGATTSDKRLPERIQFVEDEVVEDARSAYLQAGGTANVVNSTDSIRPANGGDAPAAGAQGQPWSTPILFYPDGTTSSARVLLANEHGAQIIVQLRGLTGVATLVEE
jgi:Tfp pilus assembly protein FimT